MSKVISKIISWKERGMTTRAWRAGIQGRDVVERDRREQGMTEKEKTENVTI